MQGEWCNSEMQPLDVSFMSPFKTYYAKEIDTWLKNHPNRVVTAFQVAELVGKAYMKAATLEVAVNGFRRSGIVPFDRNRFKDHDFAVQNDDGVENRDGTEPAHLPLPSTSDVQNDEDDDLSVDEESSPAPLISLSVSVTESAMVLATTSAEPAHLPLAPTLVGTQTTPSSKFCVKPADISPLPTIQSKDKKPGQQLRGGKPLLVTSSPYRNELTKKEAIPGTSKSNTKKMIPHKKKTTKTIQKTKTIKKKKTSAKENKKKKIAAEKKILQSTSSSESDEEEPPLMNSDESDAAEDEECIYCLCQYSNDIAGEKWIQCTKCFRWCHELCAGVEPHVKNFFCDLCKD